MLAARMADEDSDVNQGDGGDVRLNEWKANDVKEDFKLALQLQREGEQALEEEESEEAGGAEEMEVERDVSEDFCVKVFCILLWWGHSVAALVLMIMNDFSIEFLAAQIFLYYNQYGDPLDDSAFANLAIPEGETNETWLSECKGSSCEALVIVTMTTGGLFWTIEGALCALFLLPTILYSIRFMCCELVEDEDEASCWDCNVLNTIIFIAWIVYGFIFTFDTSDGSSDFERCKVFTWGAVIHVIFVCASVLPVIVYYRKDIIAEFRKLS